MPGALDHDRNIRPRPLFLYGTLCAIPFLAWALTGDATRTDLVRHITRNAYVKGYARYTVVGKDYPAVIKDGGDDDDDRLGRNRSQRAKLDDFEGESYKVEHVAVMVVADGEGGEERVDADMYLWNGDPEDVSKERWDLETFERERLDDWLQAVRWDGARRTGFR
ncbi:hypothetical protein HD554DRAFT_2040042 [Boletus coccyginus]|nr:hypothetical protein HD554DRAFT_2040042 [Boletus coccyginus]